MRRTCLQYNLPDPLQYLQHPWRPDRWRAHCKRTVQDYWEEKLLHAVAETPSLKYLDTQSASLSIPMRGWQLAGLCSTNVKHATVVNWMLIGVYFTSELLYKMKTAKSPYCLGCGETQKEDLKHILLQCVYYHAIREDFIPKFMLMNKSSSDIMNDDHLIILSILDPISSKLPKSYVKSWSSVTTAYAVSRQFCWNMHKRRDKLMSELLT